MSVQNLGNQRSRKLITCRPASEGYAAISQTKEPPFLSMRGTSQFMIQSKTKEPPRSYHLITCQWGVCTKIADKGAAGEGYIPANERQHNSGHTALGPCKLSQAERYGRRKLWWGGCHSRLLQHYHQLCSTHEPGAVPMFCIGGTGAVTHYKCQECPPVFPHLPSYQFRSHNLVKHI